MLKPKKEESNNHKLTLDDLARMVQNGFSQTASKQETLREDLSLLRRDMEAGFSDIKYELAPLKKYVPNLEADILEHDRRIKALEKKTGISK